jgi:hypothetical protein
MCNCSTTTETTICSQPQVCEGCKVFLSSDCINNFKEDLPCSNILKGQTLTETIVQLDAHICERFGTIENFFDLINVGTGTQIYKGISLLGKKEIRTLLDSNLINIVQGTNDITISVDEAVLTTFIGGLSGVETIVEGTNIVVNNTDPANPILSVDTEDAITNGSLKPVTSNAVFDALALGAIEAKKEYVAIPLSDLITNLTTGVNKAYFRVPYACTINSVKASVVEAQSAGSILTFDINENGVSILSTKLTIDNTEKTSTTAAIQPVISDVVLADDSEITFDIDQVGTAGAKGAIIYLNVTRV